MTVLQPVPDMSRRRRGSGPSATVVTAGGSWGPPHNFDAEESVLGAMLLSRDAIAVVVEQVSAEDFYKPSHAHIYEAITSLYAPGGAC